MAVRSLAVARNVGQSRRSSTRKKGSVPERVIKRTGRGKPGQVSPKNRLNDLGGKEWMFSTRSVLNTSYPAEYGHELRRAHSANKPPRLCKELIEFFTKKGDLVLDPFAGVGGTLLGASLSGRKAIGFEISKEWTAIYGRVSKQLKLVPQDMRYGDAMDGLPLLAQELAGRRKKVRLILTDPPYFNIGTTRSSRDKTRLVELFSRHKGDLGNIRDYDVFLDAIAAVFEEAWDVLAPGGYVAIFMKSRYIGGKFHPIPYDLARRLEKVGFEWRGEYVWNQAGQRLYPFGYPYAYVPNIVHQQIEILRKPT